jgi:hypothetical protein
MLWSKLKNKSPQCKNKKETKNTEEHWLIYNRYKNRIIFSGKLLISFF